jgi:hypothetical protein
MPSNLFSSVTSFLSGLLNIIPGIQSVAGQVAPFFVCIAFVLLVVGSMRGFLQNDTRHFFGNLVRVVILIALMGNWPTIEGAIGNGVSAFCNLEVKSGFFSTNSNSTGRLDLFGLFSTIAKKAVSINPSQNAFQQLISTINALTHPLCQILYGIYVLALLLCEFIVAGMNVLQQCIIIFLDLYVPIGFAEFSIPSLRGQAETFFKAYIGVQCWPVGWVLANIVSVNLLQGITPPNPEDAGALVLAIILCVPLILWMVIGYVLAPFYVQKVVVRGGAELQAFAGAMISAVGWTSGAVYGGAFAMAKSAALGLNQGIGSIKYPIGKRSSGARQNNNSGSQGNGSNGSQGIGADDVLHYLLPGYRGIEESGGSNGGAADRVRNLGVWGLTKALDAGEFAARTAGNMANTSGALVADASGNRIGPERNFSFPQPKRNSPNRSSRRAAKHLNESTSNRANP